MGNTPIGDASDLNWGLIAQRGVDGTGSVSTVNNIPPDENGNVEITIPDPDLSGYETVTGAQEKADAAEANAIAWGKSYGLGTVSKTLSSVDLDGVAENGLYYASAVSNRPIAENGYLIVQVLSSVYSAQKYITATTNREFRRINNNGTWSAWEEIIGSEEFTQFQDEVSSHLAEDAIDAHNASNISVADDTGLFTSSDVEGALKEAIEKANSAFTSANNGKTDIASVIGSPATSGDTFSQLKTHIQNSKNDLASNLTTKGQASAGTETLNQLVTKVLNINGAEIEVVYSGYTRVRGYDVTDFTPISPSITNINECVIVSRGMTAGVMAGIPITASRTAISFNASNAFASRAAQSSGYDSFNHYFDIVRFKNVKSIQKGTHVFNSSGTSTLTINAVVPSKTLLFFTSHTTSTNLIDSFQSCSVSNSTTLSFSGGRSGDTSAVVKFEWQLVEFK
ncbi:hypothetical protein ABE25_17980 [Cytobacillus firmus]|nr:hypothetical protein [Cytobacillus firmus]